MDDLKSSGSVFQYNWMTYVAWAILADLWLTIFWIGPSIRIPMINGGSAAKYFVQAKTFLGLNLRSHEFGERTLYHCATVKFNGGIVLWSNSTVVWK